MKQSTEATLKKEKNNNKKILDYNKPAVGSTPAGRTSSNNSKNNG
jgi:hypothetical protein